MREGGHRPLLLALVALAIAGLLSMHGLVPVVATLDGPSHPGHGSAAEPDIDVHAVAGICLFITVAAGMALARVDMKPGNVEMSSTSSPARVTGLPVMGVGPAPPLSNRFCVLRR